MFFSLDKNFQILNHILFGLLRAKGIKKEKKKKNNEIIIDHSLMLPPNHIGKRVIIINMDPKNKPKLLSEKFLGG